MPLETTNGAPSNQPNLVNVHFKAIRENAGLPLDCSLNDLRLSRATLLLHQGGHPKVVGERLGHASVTLTLAILASPTDMQQLAAERLQDALCGRD